LSQRKFILAGPGPVISSLSSLTERPLQRSYDLVMA
jgi:hypothetical protein